MNGKGKYDRISEAVKKVDKSYYIAFTTGLIVLIITIVLVATLKGENVTYLDIVFYPLLVYFIFQQVLSGFGFITGYVPIAQKIIGSLTRSAKKKAYSEKDILKLEKELERLDEVENKKKEEYKKLDQELDQKEKLIEEKIAAGSWSKRKIKREKEKLEDRRLELKKEKKKFETEVDKEKEKIDEIKKEYRGKFAERVIHRQEEQEPRKFKLIMLVPLYVMMILGIVLSLFTIIRAIIVWPGSTIPASEFLQNVVGFLGTLDLINEIYKGIIAAVSIITFYIIPAVKLFRNPEKDIAPKVLTGRRRRISDWYRRRIKKDHRTLLNRQFEDLRRYYYDIKQIIGRSLLIPIGLSQLIIAPIGGLSVVLGIKSGIKRERLEKYENMLLIIVASSLMGILVASYLFFYAKEIKSIHSMIVIIMKLLYVAFLIYSFMIFTRSPVSDVDEL